ncbi:ABC transporter permease [Klebsiella sp. BIGb0407]|uniref:ABC transporter permease n=1 Tax=Klebsiella sp. BIGb0407 TaxID=2940603 RepID=UPI002169BEF1|nr:ABC transporter permease [Klebsiella sp. BIGb0407]MCS3430660.1 ribose transport system permease protein [Klebsiella sp. BIGb0407]
MKLLSVLSVTSTVTTDKRGSNLRAWLSRLCFALVTLAFILLFSWSNPVFLTLDNWSNLLQGSAILLIVALAMTLIVSAGAIDLSVGVAIDFGAMMALIALKTWHLPWEMAVMFALLGGMTIGLVNAFLIIVCRIKPFLATLGTWFIASSVERIYTDGGGAIAMRRMAPEYHNLAVGDVLGIPIPVIIVLVIWLAAWLLTERTLFGKQVRAVGQNSEASRIAGIADKRTLFWVLVIASTLCAVGGIILSANLRQFTPLAGQSYLMDSIAAVFIGTAFNRQGRVSMSGTLGGVLFLAIVNNGLNLMGLNYLVKDALVGIILVVALAVSFWQARLRQQHV